MHLHGCFSLQVVRVMQHCDTAAFMHDCTLSVMVTADPGDLQDTCREYPIDIAFLVDGSDSITRQEFDRIKEWILLTIDAFNPSSRQMPLHVDVIQYSEDSKIEVHQLISDGVAQIEDRVRAIEQMRSGTKTYTAIRFVDTNVVPNLREGSFKILITMTDGDASDDRDVEAINQARNDFNIMIAVGVGDKVDSEELRDFSSTDKIYNVDKFSALESIITNIVENICSGIHAIVQGKIDKKIYDSTSDNDLNFN